MPEPLDYESREPRAPASAQAPLEADALPGADARFEADARLEADEARWPPPVMRSAMPADFDAVLTQSDDHAAVAAIEAALARERIACFRVDDARERVGRQVRLLIRRADRDRAALLAGAVFARRQRVREFPHMRPNKPGLAPR